MLKKYFAALAGFLMIAVIGLSGAAGAQADGKHKDGKKDLPSVSIVENCEGIGVEINAGDTHRKWRVDGEHEKWIKKDKSASFLSDADSVDDVLIEWKHKGKFKTADESYITRTPLDQNCFRPEVDVTVTPDCFPNPQEVTVANPEDNLLPFSVGFNGEDAQDVDPGSSVTYESTDDVAVSINGNALDPIEYPAVPGCPGNDGNDGNDGQDGDDGSDGSDGDDGQNGNDGNDGANGQDGNDGNDGRDGQDGADGQDGQDGEVVVVTEVVEVPTRINTGR